MRFLDGSEVVSTTPQYIRSGVTTLIYGNFIGQDPNNRRCGSYADFLQFNKNDQVTVVVNYSPTSTYVVSFDCSIFLVTIS